MCPPLAICLPLVVLLVVVGLVRGVPSVVLALFLRGVLRVLGDVLYDLLETGKFWKMFFNSDFPPIL